MRRHTRTAEEIGQTATQVQNAKLICPHPTKISHGPDSSARSAAHMTKKTGQPWEAYQCICNRFHIRRAVTR